MAILYSDTFSSRTPNAFWNASSGATWSGTDVSIAAGGRWLGATDLATSGSYPLGAGLFREIVWQVTAGDRPGFIAYNAADDEIVSLTFAAGTLFYRTLAGAWSSVAYTSGHQWRRVRLRSSGVTVSTSADGSTWVDVVTIRGAPFPDYLNQVYLNSAGGGVGNGTSTTATVVDNFTWQDYVPVAGPSLVGAVSGSLGATTSALVALPDGARSGDVLLISLVLEAPASAASPPGWTLKQSVPWGSAFSHYLWEVPYAAFGAGVIEWGGASAFNDWICAAVRDAAGVDATSGQECPFGVDAIAPSVTTTKPGCLLLFVAGTDASRSATPPPGMVEIIDQGDGHVLAAGGLLAAAGATGTRTATMSAATGSTAMLIAVAPSSGIALMTGVLDDAQRADENPLSKGGAWDSPGFTDHDPCALVSRRIVGVDGNGGAIWRTTFTDAGLGVETWADIGTADTTTEYTLFTALQPNYATLGRRGYNCWITGTQLWVVRFDAGNDSTTMVDGAAVLASPLAAGDRLGLIVADGLVSVVLRRSGGSDQLISQVADAGYTSGLSAIGLIAANRAINTPGSFARVGGGVRGAVVAVPKRMTLLGVG